jgi:tetratricopeptide (TPR) repeat protein
MPPTEQDLKALQSQLDAAVALHKQGKIDEAEAGYRRILERAPSQPDALNLLGVIHSERNKNDLAIDLLTRAATLRPKDASILNNLGRACVRIRRFEPAIEVLERAMSLSPQLLEVLGNLIQAHRALGNIDEAEFLITTLRDKKGGSITADLEQARLYSDLGRKEEARALLLKLTAEAPQYAPAWQALAKLSKVKPGDAIIDGVQAAINDAQEPSAALRMMCYAAGKVFDDLGEYDRAFEFILRAKRQDPATYSHERTRSQMTAIAEVFSERFFEARSDYGVNSKRPVFIVGMPRSGTSLAEQILSSHPDCYGGGELEYVNHIVNGLASYVPTGKFPSAAASLTREGAAVLGYQYLRKIAAMNGSAARFTDKMPHNFMTLGLLRIMFGPLQVVHCVRHPFDTCLSCFSHDFAHTHDYNQTLEGLASYYTLYRRLMEHFQAVLSGQVYVLQYEKVVSQQQAESQALTEFLGLEWSRSVLDFANNDRRVATPSSWQVRQPLYSTSDGRWRHYQRHLEPALSAIPSSYFP